MTLAPGAALLLVGCVPFAAGRVLPADGDGPLGPCPFRAATGVPCPLCGASRAFALAARGDGGFARFNGVWVLLAAALVVAGAVALAAPARGRRAAAALSRPAVAWGAAAAVVVAAWAWALAARGAIAG